MFDSDGHDLTLYLSGQSTVRTARHKSFSSFSNMSDLTGASSFVVKNMFLLLSLMTQPRLKACKCRYFEGFFFTPPQIFLSFCRGRPTYHPWGVTSRFVVCFSSKMCFAKLWFENDDREVCSIWCSSLCACDPDFPFSLCGGHSCIEVAVQNMPVTQYHWSERALGQNCMTQDKNNSWWLTCTEGRTYFVDAYEGFLARPNAEILL